ncbi:hypothetical protein M407DRAFT_19602 [Tulasnella calospora MUT 4182]|uniref:Uncharacterized protein n=1 Tax=Tulasnella calospora MUT 4182 TaxID=1051891 RepID=A0A0C3LC32_9AGAM|nr:hypothetical protein M407DRAFT_19602 [Tulasnella calospora MUT 4182]
MSDWDGVKTKSDAESTSADSDDELAPAREARGPPSTWTPATVVGSSSNAAAAVVIPAPAPAPSVRPSLYGINTLLLSRWFWGWKERSSKLDGDKFPKWLVWSSYAITVYTKYTTELNSAPKPLLDLCLYRLLRRISGQASIICQTGTLLVSISLQQGKASHLKSGWLNPSDDDAIIFKLDESAASSCKDYINFINTLNTRTQGCMTLMSGEDARVLERQAELRAGHYKSLGPG